MMVVVVALLFAGYVQASRQGCPCSDPSLCNPIKAIASKEVFAWQSGAWEHYDWSMLTTLANEGYSIPDGLLCKAHSEGVRLVFGVGYPVSQLSNSTYRAEWVQQQVEAVQSSYVDGLSVDFESPVSGEKDRSLLNAVMTDLRTAMSKATPYAQLSFCAAWSPDCIDGRCFDYASIAKASDFLFVMDYDTRSQVKTGPCVASANSPPSTTKDGLNAFLALGIPASKLVLGLPWYGYDYTCIDSPSPTTQVCNIKKVPFRGAACSDAAGRQRLYGDIMTQLNAGNTTTPVQWSTALQTPWFDYEASDGTVHQVWFDSPRSLSVKFEIARTLGIHGVGMWEAAALNYDNATQSQAMWNAFNSFLTDSVDTHVR